MNNLYLPIATKQLPRLRDAFKKHNIRFGMASNLDSVNRYWDVFSYHSASGVPESSMKMKYVQPVAGVFKHKDNDLLYDLLRANGMTTHGHCLYWGHEYSTWLPAKLNAANTDQEKFLLLRNHIMTCMVHYANWDSMDVINEGFTDGGPWYEHLGKDGIDYALEVARLASSSIKIYYNGVFIGLPDEQTAVLNLLDRGLINGVGLQWHRKAGQIDTSYIPEVVEFMLTAKAMGAVTRMSEVTIKPNGNEDTHAQKWGEAVDVALQCGVSEFVQWGICDNSGTWQGNSLLFDNHKKPKKAFYEVINRLL